MKHILTFENFLTEAIKRDSSGGYSRESVPFRDWLDEIISTNIKVYAGVNLLDQLKMDGVNNNTLKKLKEDDFFEVLMKHPKAEVWNERWRDKEAYGTLYQIGDLLRFAKKGDNSYMYFTGGIGSFGEWEKKDGKIFAYLRKEQINADKINSRFD